MSCLLQKMRNQFCCACTLRGTALGLVAASPMELVPEADGKSEALSEVKRPASTAQKVSDKKADKDARRRLAQELVVADKGTERAARDKAAQAKAASKKAADDATRAQAEAAAKAEVYRQELVAAAAEREAAEKADADQKELERLAAEKEEAERLAVEGAAAEDAEKLRAEAELAAAEVAELKRVPAWVRRLYQTWRELEKANPPPEEPLSSQSGPILFRAHTSALPLRVLLAEWAAGRADVPRAVANTVLVLRASAELDSPVMGKLLKGSEAYVLDTCQIDDGSQTFRSLITATAHTAAPLGWVTALRDGIEMLGDSRKVPKRREPKVTDFYTSFRRPYAAASAVFTTADAAAIAAAAAARRRARRLEELARLRAARRAARANEVVVEVVEDEVEEAPPPEEVVVVVHPILTLASLKKVVGGNLPRVIDIFRRMDADDSGHVDIKEFVKGMRGAFPNARKVDCQDLFKECDRDGSGTVEYEELVKIMRQVHKEEHAEPPKSARSGTNTARSVANTPKGGTKSPKAGSSAGALSPTSSRGVKA